MSTDQPKEFLRYDKMVERALRNVVKESVEEVIEHGLINDHHFYITFLTEYQGVEIPEYLMERYPGEMTIVLQYQFHDLEVNDEYMAVTLSFNNVPEKLKIPLASITIFADPSVNFALQFQPVEQEDGDNDGSEPSGIASNTEAEDKSDDDATGEVVSLDQFRKKD
jgi:hypothetical protein